MANMRWKCPECETGINAPSRLAKLDVRRWCLECSAETGKLVEKVCVVREKKRVAKKAKTVAKNKKKAATKKAAKERKRFKDAVKVLKEV